MGYHVQLRTLRFLLDLRSVGTFFETCLVKKRKFFCILGEKMCVVTIIRPVRKIGTLELVSLERST